MPDAAVPGTAKPRIAEIVPLSAEAVLRCPSCGYDLADATGFQCPECGRGFTLDELRRRTTEHASRSLWIAWCAVCALIVFAGVFAGVDGLVSTGLDAGDLVLLVMSLIIGGLPLAAMGVLRLLLPGWCERDRYFATKFVIILWPLLSPAPLFVALFVLSMKAGAF